MIWDEEIAKNEKVCPLTMRSLETGGLQHHKCLGAECMAWRGTPRFTPPNLTIRVTIPLESKIPVQEIEVPSEDIKMSSKGAGYCGVAGLPAGRA